MSTAVIPINKSDLEKAPSIEREAAGIEIVDQTSYELAATYLRDIVGPMIDDVHDAYDSICAKAYDAWKEALAKRKQYLDPLETAKATLSLKIGAHELKQSRLREEAERQAREDQERRSAEALESVIEAIEAEGGTAEEIRAVCEQPIALPKPVLVHQHQRVAGIVTRRSYEWEVTDIRALCRFVADGGPSNLVQRNSVALNAIARAQGPEMNKFVPGGRVVEVASVSTRRK
jgi:hypothetical protein